VYPIPKSMHLASAWSKTFAKTLLVMQVERAYKREQEKAAAKAEKDAAKAQRHR